MDGGLAEQHDPNRDVSCLHGSWVDGICKCDKGYVTEFTDTELYPVYCSKKNDVVILNFRVGFEIIDILHYTTLSLTVGVAVGSLLAFLFFLYTLLDACLLRRKIRKAEQKLQEFKKNMIRRDPKENLNAALWYPSLKGYRCINDPNFTPDKVVPKTKATKVLYAKVLYSYKPQASGELRLHAGDTIKDVVKLSKGWCKGYLNGQFGFYPEAYTKTFEPSALKKSGEIRGQNRKVESDDDDLSYHSFSDENTHHSQQHKLQPSRKNSKFPQQDGARINKDQKKPLTDRTEGSSKKETERKVRSGGIEEARKALLDQRGLPCTTKRLDQDSRKPLTDGNVTTHIVDHTSPKKNPQLDDIKKHKTGSFDQSSPLQNSKSDDIKKPTHVKAGRSDPLLDDVKKTTTTDKRGSPERRVEAKTDKAGPAQSADNKPRPGGMERRPEDSKQSLATSRSPEGRIVKKPLAMRRSPGGRPESSSNRPRPPSPKSKSSAALAGKSKSVINKQKSAPNVAKK